MQSNIMKNLLRSIAEKGRSLFSGKTDDSDEFKNLSSLAQLLISNKGEATGIALADEFHCLYAQSSADEKLAFYQDLATNFGPDKALLDEKIALYNKNPDEALASLALHQASEPLRQELFRRLNSAPQGTEKLVRMREDLLVLLKANKNFQVVDMDFQHLFISWFNRGFLTIEKIDWHTPASILDKIIKYEAVHEIHNWDELRSRIDPLDRCCYAFFHPSLPKEPLIFVEVALTGHISDAISTVLSDSRTSLALDDVNTAIFYSISNCQKGLKGISFGNFLIKQVVEELRTELSAIETFVTLSPVPGFMKWLQGNEDYQETFKAISAEKWWQQEETANKLEPSLTKALCTYLVKTNKDPVARFHLGNGAKLERVNWLADVSKGGINSAAGFMVNYQYVLDEIELNHEQYTTSGHVTASSQVLAHLK